MGVHANVHAYDHAQTRAYERVVILRCHCEEETEQDRTRENKKERDGKNAVKDGKSQKKTKQDRNDAKELGGSGQKTEYSNLTI